MKSFYLILICSILTLMACHKDGDTIVNEETYPDPPVVLVSTKLVSLADTTYAGFENGIQTFSNHVVHFDQLPYQQVQDAGVDRDFELVSYTTAEGYPLYKVQNLVENDVNYLHWEHPVVVRHEGVATTSATYPFSSEASLYIPANVLKDASGNIYNGAYQVFLSVMNPDAESALTIPSYSGLKKDGAFVSLDFSACYYIHIQTPEKTPLLLNEGVVISNDQYNGEAWHFDPERSTWISDDAGGNEATIPVSKSGYYAFADASRMVRVEGTIIINGKATPHYPLEIRYNDQVRRIFSTNRGKWVIQVPAETEITTSVNLPCASVEEMHFTTTNEAVQHFPFNVYAGEITNAHITGTARDCFGEPLTNHVILVSSGENQFLFQDQAELSVNLAACTGQMIGVRTLDLETNEYGPEVFWPVASDIDVSTSFGCALANEEYLMLKIDGDRKMYWDFESSMTPQDRLLINNGAEELNLDFQLFISGMIEGNYTDTDLNIEFEDQSFGNKGYALYCPTSTDGCGFTEFRITHFPQQSGEWIRGRFKGNFWMKTFHPLTAGYRTMEGEFQVYKDF